VTADILFALQHCNWWSDNWLVCGLM